VPRRLHPDRDRNRRRALTAAWAGALLALSSHAQSVDPLQARSWAAACAACHGTNGHSQPGNEPLAGMKASDIIEKVQDFRSGRKQSTVMQQLAKGYSDAEIAAIASWFAGQGK
jgi:cytochrome c553